MGKEIFRESKLKDIRRTLTDKNILELYYIIDNKITLVFSVTREIVGRKAQFHIYSHLDVEYALQNSFLKWYSNKAHDFEGNSYFGDRKDVYARINFTKKVFMKYHEEDFILDLEEQFPKVIDTLKVINIDNLSYKEYFKTMQNTINDVKIYWTKALYIKCIWTCFEQLGIKFIAANDTFTWWYLGYTMSTKIVSFGWLGAGTCYRPITTVNDKKINSELLSKESSHWVWNSIFKPLATINLLNGIGVFSDYVQLTDFNKTKFITGTFPELESGNRYYPDDCWESDKEKEEYRNKNYKFFSDKPNFEEICSRLEILFGINVKNKLLELGYTKVILGYFNYLDMYIHPVRHSSVSSWAYSNPFVLDIESGKVTYEVLRNNDVLGYNEVKIKDDTLMVTATVPSDNKYGYIIDLY